VKWLATQRGDTGLTSRLNVSFGASFEHAVADGSVIAGTPQTVRAEIERQAAALGINYLLSYLFLGNMTLADALRSLALFKSEVMPHLAKI
jgi:alkanesulfonate monooxygenase SsuD/methylene tetrahydromethanopterin reductase-like flavin-dependent oxidoreductase (luciferase family)